MTYQEIIEKYKELFVILVESIGHETRNTSYIKVSELLEKEDEKKLINQAIEQEADFKITVTVFIFIVLYDIYGKEVMKEWDNEVAAEKVTEFYEQFLRKSTRKFCSKYGMEVFDDPETSFRLLTNIKKNYD